MCESPSQLPFSHLWSSFTVSTSWLFQNSFQPDVPLLPLPQFWEQHNSCCCQCVSSSDCISDLRGTWSPSFSFVFDAVNGFFFSVFITLSKWRDTGDWKKCCCYLLRTSSSTILTYGMYSDVQSTFLWFKIWKELDTEFYCYT